MNRDLQRRDVASEDDFERISGQLIVAGKNHPEFITAAYNFIVDMLNSTNYRRRVAETKHIPDVANIIASYGAPEITDGELMNWLTEYIHETSHKKLAVWLRHDYSISLNWRLPTDEVLHLGSISIDRNQNVCLNPYLTYKVINLCSVVNERNASGEIIDRRFSIGDKQLVRKIRSAATQLAKTYQTPQQ
jgi:hypothetical protein